MNSRNTVFPSLALLGVAALLLARCESTDLLGPEGGQLLLTATPQTAVVDPASGRARSTIRAQVLDAGSVPVENAAVTFAPAAGTLVDNTCVSGACSLAAGACSADVDCPLPPTAVQTQKTDAQGLTEVVLVLTAADGDPVAVSATSGTLTGSTSVLNILGVENDAPDAEVAALQSSPVLGGGPVDFDGSGSSDPDGDPLTCYQWTIDSSIPIENRTGCVPPVVDDFKCVIQGAGEQLITLNYVMEQRLTVHLAVSDAVPDDVDCFRAGPIVGTPPLSTSTDSISNFVICDNDPPSAEAGTYLPVARVNGTAIVSLDGSLSADPENPGDNGGLNFVWNCGNQTTATGETTSCSYTVAGSYNVQLTVTDPGNGQAACGKSDTDSTVVTVTN